MNTPKIRLRTEGFRAISSADIRINGITVVAGENASGKSTLSKLLYYLFRTAINYDLLVAQSLRNKFRDLNRALEVLINEAGFYSSEKNPRPRLRDELNSLDKRFGKQALTNEDKESWLSLIKKVEDTYIAGQHLQEKLYRTPDNKRIRYILNDLLNEKEGLLDKDDDNQPIPWGKITELVDSIFKEAFGKMNSRPSSLLTNKFENIFRESPLPNKFEVYEYDERIVSNDKSNLSIPYSIQNTIYIDTPMMIGLPLYFNEYWEDLNELLRKRSGESPQELSKLISKEIIGGEVAVEGKRFDQQFSYKRNDGAIFNLLDVATGIKAFGIIELLLNNGSLTDKTLLIIDEPESNLHPQWIIEYARLIVLLNKEIGVKFFIASHNPDMVSALKYISVKEGIEKDLSFYLAKKLDNKNHLFDYKDLETNIDPIFASFNIALDRINQYGI